MAHTSPRRGLLRSAFALSCLSLASSCGADKPEAPLPPLVTLNIPEPNTIGLGLKMSVTATGCDAVQSLSLLNNGVPLKGIPYAGGEAQVELGKHEVPYTTGIAASLALSARVVCADGRQSDSQSSAATFFPVKSVTEPTGNGQVVPDYFVAEGRDANVKFIGCGNESPTLPMLYRVDSKGEGTKLPMSFTCTAGTVITDPHLGPGAAAGARWVWTPDSGVMAINASFVQTARANPHLYLSWLTMDPDGNAIAKETTGDLVGLNRVGGTADIVRWRYSFSGTPIGEPVFRPELGVMLLPVYGNTSAPSAAGEVRILTINYRTGTEVDRLVVRYIYGQDPTPPAAAFNADGQSLYLSFLTAGKTIVLACPTSGSDCEDSHEKWRSDPIEGDVVALIPYAGGTRLAAIAARHAWFLDPSNRGAVLNKNKTALSPSGGLVVRQVQGGISGINGGQEFYLLNSSQSSLQTTEIVGMDRAENGEVFRYSVGGGDLSIALDASGALWMRVGEKLVQALSLNEYRQAGPKT
jgi:hypothetical protein